MAVRKYEIQDILRKTSSILLDVVFPPRCPVCGGLSEGIGKTCLKCKDVFVIIKEPRCMKCGKALNNLQKDLCADCTKKKFHYIKGFPLWNYDSAMRKSVSAFKYHNKKEYGSFYARIIAREMGEDIVGTGCQAFIPVPVHKSRLKKRGYNQAKVLADELSKRLHIQVIDDVLIRTKKTTPQKELNDIERLKNLCSAFEINQQNDIIRERNIKTVMLVDDIYTTGSTIEACTLELLKAGVENVYFTSVCIGRGFN